MLLHIALLTAITDNFSLKDWFGLVWRNFFGSDVDKVIFNQMLAEKVTQRWLPAAGDWLSMVVGMIPGLVGVFIVFFAMLNAPRIAKKVINRWM